jgi:regulator of replication initiation timing
MQRRRQNWASNGRRDDEKRDTRDEFDDMEAFMSKKKRQLGDLKEENDRLRSEKGRLRADLARRSQAVAHLESQLKDAKTVAIKRCKSILDDAFAIFDVPAGVANGKAARDGSAEDDESSDRSEYGVDPPADLAPVPGAAAPAAAPAAPAAPLPLAGPGDAAPSPAEKQEETSREQAPTEYVIPEFAIGGNDPH